MFKKNLSKITAVALSVICMAGAVGCGSASGTSGTADNNSKSSAITVVSREDGSGTRGAFIELTGVEEKDASGKKVDNTTVDASIVNSTSVVMTTVAGDDNAIGYISLGSLNSTVKALNVNGVEATAANVKNGTYELARPFNIATKATVSEAAQDFINYILSADGQKIVEDNKYISEGNKGTFTSTKPSGKVVVAGSSSVSPVMEKLIEAYKSINSNVTIELQTSDSTTGMTAAMDGTCDIGMASRDLKDSEKSSLTGTAIALDGIAVIVHNNNSLTNITTDTIKGIYTGSLKNWSEVK